MEGHDRTPTLANLSTIGTLSSSQGSTSHVVPGVPGSAGVVPGTSNSALPPRCIYTSWEVVVVTHNGGIPDWRGNS